MTDLKTKRFSKKNDGFICENCKKEVQPASKTCRNHCPFCLHSKHVDLLPGDRANPCQGLMKPIGYETTGKNRIILVFKCTKCGAITRNKSVQETCLQDDSYDEILKLTQKY